MKVGGRKIVIHRSRHMKRSGLGSSARRLQIIMILVLMVWPSLPPGAAFAASLSELEGQTILQQLNELRQDIKALRGEVGQLRKAVTEIHRAAVSPSRTPPRQPVKVDVPLGQTPRLGNPEATVGIVEFTDYQCPFCQRFHVQTFGQLKEQYIETKKIQYIVRDFPLDFHRHAKDASIAAHCTGQQGAYWAMHHELFTNQRRLGPDLYEELATTLELDGQEFLSCLKAPEQAKAVEADLAYGQQIGVRGTPNFFIGRIDDGKLVKATQITGSQPFSAFSQAIDSLLK